MIPRPPPPRQRASAERPEHDAGPHPARPVGASTAEPRTDVLDISAPPTVRLRALVADTVRIPTAPGGPAPGGPAGGAPAPGAPREAADGAPAAEGRSGGADGLALSLSSVIGSLAGLVSWLVAARMMTRTEVGDAQLVVSAFILVGGAAQLNLGVGLMRWLPQAGRSTSRLVWSSLLLILPLSGAIGLGYALLVPRLATISAGPDGAFALGLLLFVLATAGWGVFVVHDFILVTLGKPWWAVWRNAAFAVVRIGLLVLLGGAAGLGSYGIVLSWVGPIVVWIALGSAVVAVLARRATARARGAGTLPARREAIAFLAPTAVAQFGGALLYNQVPVVLNLRLGPEAGAVFFIAWQAVTVIDIAGMFFMNSLAVGVAREPHRAAELAAAARRRLLVLFLPALAAGALLAHPVLLVFGPAYAEADTLLQVLMLGLAFRLVVLHELGVRQAAGDALGYARLQLISTLLVLLTAVVTPVAGADVAALLPVALGYVVVQVACAAAVLFSPARRRADVEVPAP